MKQKFTVKIVTDYEVVAPDPPVTLFLEDNQGTVSIENIPDDVLVKIGEAWTARILEKARALRESTKKKKEEAAAKKKQVSPAAPAPAPVPPPYDPKSIQRILEDLEKAEKERQKANPWPSINPIAPPPYLPPYNPYNPFDKKIGGPYPPTPWQPGPEIWCGQAPQVVNYSADMKVGIGANGFVYPAKPAEDGKV